MANEGFVKQIIGVVIDVEFPDGNLPALYNALHIDRGEQGTLTLEVQQHLGAGQARCVALGSTDGVKRGMEVIDTGSPVTVPVASTFGAWEFWIIFSISRASETYLNTARSYTAYRPAA